MDDAGAARLPKGWVRYQGMYVNGDRVVFRYTVGDAEVLESARFENRSGRPGIAREIRNSLSEMNTFLSALDKICQGSKTLEPKRKKTANEFYLKAKSASEKIEKVIRRCTKAAIHPTARGERRKSDPGRG